MLIRRRLTLSKGVFVMSKTTRFYLLLVLLLLAVQGGSAYCGQ